MDNDLNVLTLYNEKNMPRIKAFKIGRASCRERV